MSAPMQYFGSSTVQTHREYEGGREDVRDGHVVGGEGARLVGADDVGAAQGLDGGQLAHHGVPLGHPHDAEGQGDGHHDGQALKRARSVAGCLFCTLKYRVVQLNFAQESILYAV